MRGDAQYHGSHDQEAQLIKDNVSGHADDVGFIQSDAVEKTVFLTALMHLVFIKFGQEYRVGGMTVLTVFHRLICVQYLVHVGVGGR